MDASQPYSALSEYEASSISSGPYPTGRVVLENSTAQFRNSQLKSYINYSNSVLGNSQVNPSASHFNEGMGSPLLKKSWKKIELSGCELSSVVFLTVITAGLYRVYQNVTLEKALMENDLAQATLCLKSGSCRYLDSKQIMQLIKSNKEQSLALMFSQIDGSIAKDALKEISHVLQELKSNPHERSSYLMALQIFLDCKPAASFQDLDFLQPHFVSASHNKDYEIMSIFFNSGLDPQSCVVKNEGHLAFHDITEESITYWIENAGLDVNTIQKEIRPVTLLWWATATGRHDVAAYLIKKKASLDTEGCYAALKGTPLHVAVKSERAEMITLLLAAGADPHRKLKDNNGTFIEKSSPLDLAREQYNPHTLIPFLGYLEPLLEKDIRDLLQQRSSL